MASEANPPLITIPASVTSIGGYVFFNCSNLVTVTFNSNPTIGTYAFKNIKADATVTMNLTGHEGKTGEYWMTFYNKNYGKKMKNGSQLASVFSCGF